MLFRVPQACWVPVQRRFYHKDATILQPNPNEIRASQHQSEGTDHRHAGVGTAVGKGVVSACGDRPIWDPTGQRENFVDFLIFGVY